MSTWVVRRVVTRVVTCVVTRPIAALPAGAVVVTVAGAGCHAAAPVAAPSRVTERASAGAPRAARDSCGAGRGYVVMLSLDGFRADYLRSGDTPNLARIAAAGVRAQSLVPVFPSKTFPNHYSIVTGLYVEHHGLANNQFYDPATARVYRVSDTTAVRDASFYAGEPLWVTAERQGVRSAVFLWPGSEAPIGGLHPSRYKRWTTDHLVPPAARIDTVLSWLALPPCERPHLVLAYDEAVDEAGHEGGPDAPATRAAVRAADSVVGRLYDGLQVSPRRDSITLLVVSDHGMASVAHVLDLGPAPVRDPAHPVVALGDGVVGSWWSNDSAALRRIRAALDTVPHAHVYWRTELPPRYRASIARIGDLVLVADVGWRIGYGAPRAGGGNHGYDPAAPEMQALFVAAGAGLRHGVVLPRLANVHIYPLIASLLALQPAPTDGRLDATAAARTR